MSPRRTAAPINTARIRRFGFDTEIVPGEYFPRVPAPDRSLRGGATRRDQQVVRTEHHPGGAPQTTHCRGDVERCGCDCSGRSDVIPSTSSMARWVCSPRCGRAWCRRAPRPRQELDTRVRDPVLPALPSRATRRVHGALAALVVLPLRQAPHATSRGLPIVLVADSGTELDGAPSSDASRCRARLPSGATCGHDLRDTWTDEPFPLHSPINLAPPLITIAWTATSPSSL